MGSSKGTDQYFANNSGIPGGVTATTTGGSAEKQQLLKDIEASGELLPAEMKAAYLQRASSIEENVQYNFSGQLGGIGLTSGSRSLEDINALRNEFQQVTQDRQTELLKNRARLAAELEALQKTPGSRQTSNLTALAPKSGIPSLLGQ